MCLLGRQYDFPESGSVMKWRDFAVITTAGSLFCALPKFKGGKSMFVQVLLLMAGFILLIKGADWFVDGASEIASKLRVPQIIIGLTIVAMGTSSPEAAVSIFAALTDSADITIGNIVGSNILNVLIILGLSAVITPLTVNKSTMQRDMPFLMGVSFLLLLQGWDGVISLFDGLVQLALFLPILFFCC